MTAAAGSGATAGADVVEPIAPPEAALRAHLGLPGATALAITVVVGSGALVLPGIAYEQAGDSAVLAWAIAAAVTVPLLVIFARLGSRYPGAGGVAGFVEAAFGRPAGAAVEVLLLGTFSLGIPAIAMTGGNYVIRLFDGSDVAALLTAGALLAGAALVVAIGVRLSGRVQTVLAIALTVGLLGAAAVAIQAPARSLTVSVPETGAAWLAVAATVGTVFFAFTGWEMISFTTEEYRNPKRDFPRVVILSFVLVTVMYLALAVGLQLQLAPGDAGLSTAPIGSMVDRAAGAGAAQAVALLGVIVIAANLVGAVWGASRLVMSSARSGLLPRPLARVHAASASPRRAVMACLLGFLLVIGVHAAGVLSLGQLLGAAGRNFFLIYLLSGLAFSRLSQGPARVFGVGVTAVLATVTLGFGWASWLYAAGLLVAGVLLHLYRVRRLSPSTAPGAVDVPSDN